MKPWTVVLYGANPRQIQAFHDGVGKTGRIYTSRDQREYHNPGEISDNQHVYFCDDEPTADALIQYLADQNPTGSYVKCKSVSCAYREFGPRKNGVFNEQGLLPA